ncbi:MAG: site-specific integrase [Alphaproteobacteria bacterium]|nr:site-specific integrase [Alphaproteobacteria bacterium]
MLDAWKRLKPHFGHLRPDQINRMTCRAYTEDRRRAGVSDGTIIKELTTLRAALRWHDKNTPAQFEMPSAPAPRERYLTKEEFIALRDACSRPHVKLFVILALSTAGRASAILELTWDRVDFERGLIRLAIPDDHGRKKGRAIVPMTTMARAALEEAKRGALTNHVIEYAERPVASVKKGFGDACRRAGLEGVTPHTLRHTAAVWMAEAGTPMTEIATFLGHTDSQITERVYARYSPEYLRTAATALDL